MQRNRIPGPGQSPADQSSYLATAASAARTGLNGKIGSSLTDSISQAELVEYVSLNDQKKQLDAEFNARRQGLLERLEDGEFTEPGRFRAEIRSCKRRRLTAEEIERILGPDKIEELKSLVIPTIMNQLWVIEKVEGSMSNPNRRRNTSRPKVAQTAEPIPTVVNVVATGDSALKYPKHVPLETVSEPGFDYADQTA